MNHCTIIIPQKRKTELTQNLVNQIRLHQTSTILVVNDDPDDDPVVIGAAVIPNSGLGVTAAWNTGIVHSETEYILLLNNDVNCSGAFVEQLIEAAGDGISGAAWRMEAIVNLNLLQGWCLCFKKDLWYRLEGFDTRFQIYWQDTDFQFRAEKRAIKLNQVEIPLIHTHAGTSRDPSILPDRIQIKHRDRAAFLSKHKL